jgi:hypothetical protein
VRTASEWDRAAAVHHAGPSGVKVADWAGGVGRAQRPGDVGRAWGDRGWRLPQGTRAPALEQAGAMVGHFDKVFRRTHLACHNRRGDTSAVIAQDSPLVSVEGEQVNPKVVRG